MSTIQTKNPVYWVSQKAAQLSDRAETVKNSLSVITSALRFLQNVSNELPKIPKFMQWVSLEDVAEPVRQLIEKIIPCVKDVLPIINPINNTFEVVKDYLTFLELFTNLRDYQTKKFDTFGKQGEIACKLGYSSLETVLLLPNKLKWLELATWVGEKATACLKIGSWSFVLGASAFSVWNATQSIEEAKQAQKSDKEKISKLKEIYDCKSDTDRRTLMREYLSIEPTVYKDKIPKLVRSYGEIFDCLYKTESLENRRAALNANPIHNASQITDLSNLLEKNKSRLQNLKQKVKRVVFFTEEARGINISQNALRLAQNLRLKGFIEFKLDTIQDPTKKDILQKSITPANMQNGNLLQDIETALNTGEDAEDDKFLTELIKGTKNTNEYLHALTDYEIRQRTVKQILDYKIRKIARDYELKASQEARGYRKINYEITKVAIVASVILLTLITNAFLPAIFVNAAAALSFGLWVSGLGISITGLQRTIFETFYFKDSEKILVPTTNLA